MDAAAGMLIFSISLADFPNPYGGNLILIARLIS
jgi:hypothetical protein